MRAPLAAAVVLWALACMNPVRDAAELDGEGNARRLSASDQEVKDFREHRERQLAGIHLQLGSMLEGRGDVAGAVAEYEAALGSSAPVDVVRISAAMSVADAYDRLSPPHVEDAVRALGTLADVVCSRPGTSMACLDALERLTEARERAHPGADPNAPAGGVSLALPHCRPAATSP